MLPSFTSTTPSTGKCATGELSDRVDEGAASILRTLEAVSVKLCFKGLFANCVRFLFAGIPPLRNGSSVEHRRSGQVKVHVEGTLSDLKTPFA